MSKSSSDTFGSDLYKSNNIRGLNQANSTGGYNTLRSTIKSTTISSIPGMLVRKTIAFKILRGKRFVDFGRGDEGLPTSRWPGIWW